jgi:hypothetical protein
VYHEQVSVGEIPDLASCDGDWPTPDVVDHWLHYGPLLVSGRSGGSAGPAHATLAAPAGNPVAIEGRMAVILFFAHAGQLILDLPVDRA